MNGHDTRVAKTLRVLDFDIEARPLSWYAGDMTSREVTVIAAQFIGEPATYCWALGEVELPEMMEGFVGLYNEADMVTGHFIRGFDLPNINGQLAELAMPLLSPKLSHDTKNDLKKMQGMSKSQENLDDMLRGADLKVSEKVSMTQRAWRSANRLEPQGIAEAKHRCVGDVHQHIAMRAALLDRGLLNPPKVWKP